MRYFCCIGLIISLCLNAQTINRQCDRSRDEFVPSGGLDYIKMNQINSTLFHERNYGKHSKNWKKYYPLLSHFISNHFESQESISMIEIGTCHGGNADYILNHLKRVQLYVIDPFLPNYDTDDSVSLMFNNYAHKYNLSDQQISNYWTHAMFHDMEQKYGCRYKLFNTTSSNACRFFSDKSMDVIFIDGLHTYEGVKQDIICFAPKLKENGILLFNDYEVRMFPGVTKAVNRYAFSNDLTVGTGTNLRPPGQSNAFIIRLPNRSWGRWKEENRKSNGMINT